MKWRLFIYHRGFNGGRWLLQGRLARFSLSCSVVVNIYLIPNLESRLIDLKGGEHCSAVKWTMIHDEWYWESGQPLGMGCSSRRTTCYKAEAAGAAKNKKIHSSGHWWSQKEIPKRLNNAVLLLCSGFMAGAAERGRDWKWDIIYEA